jgi:hypothetical protein
MNESLKTVTIWTVTFGAIILLAIGYNIALTNTNTKIEAKCQAVGGQVIVTPGEVTQCLRPALAAQLK